MSQPLSAKENPLSNHTVSNSLATCSFPEMRPEFGLPVRTSNGYPRYKLKYELPGDQKIPELMPHRSYMHGPAETFHVRYRQQMDDLGVDKISRIFADLRTTYGAERLVLLCFEQLWQPKNAAGCHRSSFAAWWLDQTGEIIPELGKPAPVLAEEATLL
jgi:hypothetical protein